MLHTIFPPHGATYEQATLLGVVLCLLTALVRYLPNRSVKYAPGPKPLPLLGNIIYFSKMLKNLPVEVPLMAKRFGGTCMMWMGSKPILMIHKLEDAHELLSKVSIQTIFFFFLITMITLQRNALLILK